MDANKINLVLEGRAGLDELSVADRMAFAKLIVRAEVKPAPERLPLRFTVPPALERLIRGPSI